MEDAVYHFNTFKDVSLLGQASKIAKAKANALTTQLMKKRKVDTATHADTRMPSKMLLENSAWPDSISHKINVSKGLDTDFNIPKFHFRFHCVEQIHWYGALQQYSPDRHEQGHKMNLRAGCNASNHNLNYLPQVITV